VARGSDDGRGDFSDGEAVRSRHCATARPLDPTGRPIGMGRGGTPAPTSSVHPEPTCGFFELVVFVGALAAGTGCSLFSKVLLSMRGVGKDGVEESFQNPLFQVWGMFLGMCASLPMHLANEARKKKRWHRARRRGYDTIEDGAPPAAGRDDDTTIDDAIDGGGSEAPPKAIPASTYYVLAIPSLFDLAATAFAMFGLTYITVSVYQMLRGAAIIFVAIFKHFLLGDKLLPFMWVGVALNVVSIVMVGLTASEADSAGGSSSSSSSPLIGVALILCGAFVQGLQYAFEERVMAGDVGAPPLLVIAMEGVWGLLVCTVVLYPACWAAGLEDPTDTWAMIAHSPQIQLVFALYFVSVFSYNLLAVLVTYMLNSVWHAILDNFRPITVWGTDLVIFYVCSHGRFGEAWDFPGSYIQLAALGVLLYGTAVYNGSVKLPGFAYPDDVDEEPAALVKPSWRPSFRDSPMIIRASPGMASSAIGRSPLIHGRLPGQHPGLPSQSGGPPGPQPAILQMGARGRSNSFQGS